MLLIKGVYLLYKERFALSSEFICHPFDWSRVAFFPENRLNCIIVDFFHDDDVDIP